MCDTDHHVGPPWSLHRGRIQTPSSLESLNIRAVVDLEEWTQPLMLQRQKQTFQEFLEGWANTVWSTLRNFCTHPKPCWLAELLLADQHLFQTRKRVGVTSLMSYQQLFEKVVGTQKNLTLWPRALRHLLQTHHLCRDALTKAGALLPALCASLFPVPSLLIAWLLKT